MNLKHHCIQTGSDGELDGTTLADIDTLVKRLENQDRILIHLHGGLVSEKKAMAKARELIPEYQSAGAYPLFFIYRTGLLEIVRNNLHEIAQEKIFATLIKKLLKYVVGKLVTVGGAKSAGGLEMPKDIEIAIAGKALAENREPFTDVQPVENLKEVTDEEERQLIDALATDIEFQAEIQAIVDGATADQEKVFTGAKGAIVSHRVSAKTLMSADIVQELVEDAGQKDGKGIFSTAKALVRAGKILKRVIKRFIKKRDHGVYTTVVEEVLREFYLANIGATVWELMKQETADTFDASPSGAVRGGRYFFEVFGRMLKDTGQHPEVTVVAHSLGSVFSCNLIQHVGAERKNSAHPLPPDFCLENLILLAPAVECSHFARTLRKHDNLIKNFRMFALNEELESGYWEVPVVYPRSLLYLVSGAFERTDDEKSAFDRPLVGMERYYARTNVYKGADEKKVRQYVNDRVVWSEDDRGPGLDSDCIRHGGFDDAIFKAGVTVRRKTIDSILHILQNGM